MPGSPPPPDAASTPFTPTWMWMLRSPARILALGFGSGLLRPGPGTWGTALAWLLWAVFFSRLPDMVVAGGLLACFAYGCWCCQRVGRELGNADSSAMVWDEFVAFWLVLWLLPGSFWIQALAFLVFRFFDIVKPPPIRYFDARLKHGFGVMLDDVLAAGYSLFLLAVVIRTGLLL